MKTSNIANIVKINPPMLASNIYLRKRLFKALTFIYIGSILLFMLFIDTLYSFLIEYG